MSAVAKRRVAQGGMALVSSILLLLIITILALSMFKSMGSQEKIAGNIREKDRALHAAESAQQYAEWWLLQPAAVATAPSACQAGVPLNANAGEGQICSSATSLKNLNVSVTDVPWNIAGAVVTYVQYSPIGMATPLQAGNNGDPTFAWTPGFYIADLGPAADVQGEAYQISAFSSGATTSTVAVVESTYEVQQGVVNRGGL